MMLPVTLVESRSSERASPPAGRWAAAALQVALIAAFYQWYSVARYWVAGSEALARHNALRLVTLERALGVFNESAVQAAVLPSAALRYAAAFYYGVVH